MTKNSTKPGWADVSFWGELAGLALAAPFFYLSGRLPGWGPLAGLVLLAAAWVWRRRRLGIWLVRTPADWPIFLLLLLLPLAVWVAAPPLRSQYAFERAWILVWNAAFFSLIALHSARSESLRVLTAGGLVAAGAFVAAVALFGTRWDTKVPLLTALLERLPHLPTGRFNGAGEGVSSLGVA